jgi:DNA-binding NtrC family response regulator
MGLHNKVMVVDDQVLIRTMLLEVLNSNEFTAVAASNGQDALNLARLEMPDIALLDFNIPKIDGLTLFKKLKMIKPGIKAVFMTGSPNVNIAKSALEQGAQDVIVKPFDIFVMVKMLKEISSITTRGEEEWKIINKKDGII